MYAPKQADCRACSLDSTLALPYPFLTGVLSYNWSREQSLMGRGKSRIWLVILVLILALLGAGAFYVWPAPGG